VYRFYFVIILSCTDLVLEVESSLSVGSPIIISEPALDNSVLAGNQAEELDNLSAPVDMSGHSQ